ncbi:MAG: type II toxin-antitoxin system ParD family antitoxin [Planctomycetes bacterium]|nr:type II toxin-antitoxin system ParD family antitoxin [Planctomycetota bacterium]
MGKNTSISLGAHFEGFIASQVETGLYGNRSEVVRAALREMEERQRRAETLELMERSMADIDAGRTRPAKKALKQIADKLRLHLDN